MNDKQLDMVLRYLNEGIEIDKHRWLMETIKEEYKYTGDEEDIYDNRYTTIITSLNKSIEDLCNAFGEKYNKNIMEFDRYIFRNTKKDLYVAPYILFISIYNMQDCFSIDREAAKKLADKWAKTISGFLSKEINIPGASFTLLKYGDGTQICLTIKGTDTFEKICKAKINYSKLKKNFDSMIPEISKYASSGADILAKKKELSQAIDKYIKNGEFDKAKEIVNASDLDDKWKKDTLSYIDYKEKMYIANEKKANRKDIKDEDGKILFKLYTDQNDQFYIINNIKFESKAVYVNEDLDKFENDKNLQQMYIDHAAQDITNAAKEYKNHINEIYKNIFAEIKYQCDDWLEEDKLNKLSINSNVKGKCTIGDTITYYCSKDGKNRSFTFDVWCKPGISSLSVECNCIIRFKDKEIKFVIDNVYGDF